MKPLHAIQLGLGIACFCRRFTRATLGFSERELPGAMLFAAGEAFRVRLTPQTYDLLRTSPRSPLLLSKPQGIGLNVEVHERLARFHHLPGAHGHGDDASGDWRLHRVCGSNSLEPC